MEELNGYKKTDRANRFVQALMDTGWELTSTQQLLIMEKYTNTF
jgi:hypothetical protein